MQASEGRERPSRSEEGENGETGGEGEVERERTGTKAFRNQRMEPMFKCKQSSRIWRSLNETQRRGYFLMYFVLSLSLSTFIKS